MKNIAVTVIVGFITGLVISGILFDVIKYVGKSFNRVSVSWNISKAEKAYSNERFSDSVLIYRKTLPKISSDNKILLAKTKNNLALSMLKNIEKESNINLSDDAENLSNISDNVLLEIEEVLDLLNQANDLYIETGNTELSAQTTKNIQIIESFLSKDKKS
ncbi:MAG: hypothetical protein J6U02_03235 [Elusimicrobia bacterium]|nr:hypothetical protein [Elusimicrobiota bacterium]